MAKTLTRSYNGWPVFLFNVNFLTAQHKIFKLFRKMRYTLRMCFFLGGNEAWNNSSNSCWIILRKSDLNVALFVLLRLCLFSLLSSFRMFHFIEISSWEVYINLFYRDYVCFHRHLHLFEYFIRYYVYINFGKFV